MKKSVFFFSALCSGTLLLSSCNSDKTADSTATTTETTSTDAASGDMAGMDESKMAGMDESKMAGDSPQMKAMNDNMAKMAAMKMKGNVDHDFAHMIIEHHKGAIAMSDIELRDGKDAHMKEMAAKTKADQEKEIAELEPIAERLDSAPNNYQPLDPADPFTSKMKASMDNMMQNMPTMSANSDMNYNMLMTVHHQGALELAQAQVDHGKDTKLKEMAQKMIAAQKKEIADLKDWHDKNADKM